MPDIVIEFMLKFPTSILEDTSMEGLLRAFSAFIDRGDEDEVMNILTEHLP